MAEHADAVRAELLALLEAGAGTIRPGDVVAYAKNPDTALHEHFTWDDGEAAEQYRIIEARYLLRRVKVVVEHPKTGEPVRYRVAVSLSPDRQSGVGYRSVQVVMGDEEMRETLIADARRDVASFRQRYKELHDLPGLFDALDQLEGALRPSAVAA